jgi:hypothetical protein
LACSRQPTLSERDIVSSDWSFYDLVSYTDGGSLGYFFKDDHDQTMGIILPVRLGESMQRLNVTDGSQVVQLVDNEQFANDEVLFVQTDTALEDKLIEIVNTQGRDVDNDSRAELERLESALKTRNFMWLSYYNEITEKD